MKCIICNTQTDNPKFCSVKCRQKDWRSKKKSLDELIVILNYVMQEEPDKLQGKEMLQILTYLYGDDRQVLFTGERYVLV